MVIIAKCNTSSFSGVVDFRDMACTPLVSAGPGPLLVVCLRYKPPNGRPRRRRDVKNLCD